MSLRAVFTDSKGQQRTIKVPWYAALAGASPVRAPPPKPKCEKSKDKPCGKCNGCKGKGGGKGGDQKGGAKDEGNKSGDKDHSTGDEETYTAKDDKKIIELKNDGKTWQEILDAIQKKSKSQLQNHWKNDLQAKAEGGGGDNDKKGDQKDGNAKDNQGKGGGKVQGKKAGLGDQMAKQLEKEEARKWDNMASRHFDKTGERISAEQAKQKYGN